MKIKGIFLMCLMFGCVAAHAGENEPSPGITLWGLTADNADSLMVLRIGYETKGRIEIGGTCKWKTGNPPWGPEPDLAGLYAIYHINEILGIDDVEPDSDWEKLLHQLVGRPYMGGEAIYNLDGEERVRTNLIIGTLFGVADDPDYRIGFAVEYTSGDASDETVTLGLRVKF